MKGLALSRLYFEKHGYPMLKTHFPDYMDKIAVGLVGEGSECFGFDDAFSQDHDFGPGFCIWLSDEVYREIGAKMQNAYDSLPNEFEGFAGRKSSPYAGKRVGVFSIEGFYRQYLNGYVVPSNPLEWFKIPTTHLATATNGEVFLDAAGTFSSIRQYLLQFYPKDVVYKKLAATLMKMGQSGQYNYVRATQRGDKGAAYLALGEFVNAAMASVYLLNKRYMPFYKWVFRGSQDFNSLQETIIKIRQLIESVDEARNRTLIESISVDISSFLRQEGMTDVHDDFLVTHAHALMGHIADEQLRRLPAEFDF